MALNALQKLKASSFFDGPSKKEGSEAGSPFFSDSEIALLRQQLKENSDAAAEAVERAGVKLHPRVAALRER